MRPAMENALREPRTESRSAGGPGAAAAGGPAQAYSAADPHANLRFSASRFRSRRVHFIGIGGSGMSGLASMLLDSGADVNAADLTGLTALMAASIGGHADSARILLEHNAKVNAATVDGTTALMYASMFRHKAVCVALIAAGASVTARDRDGVSAADRARTHGDLDMLALLYRALPLMSPLAA